MDALELNAQQQIEALKNNVLSFKELLDAYAQPTQNNIKANSINVFLNDHTLIKSLIKHNMLNKQNILCLMNCIEQWYEVNCLISNPFLLRHLMKQNMFEEFIEKCKKTNTLLRFFYIDNHYGQNAIEDLIENNLLSKNEVKHMLDKIDTEDELCIFVQSRCLLSITLENFLIDQHSLTKFESVVKRINDAPWYQKPKKLQTFFDLIEDAVKLDDPIMNLVELNKYAYNFTNEQKEILSQLLMSSDAIQARLEFLVKHNAKHLFEHFDELDQLLTSTDDEFEKLKYIVENNLENTFETFEKLFAYMKRQDKKLYLSV